MPIHEIESSANGKFFVTAQFKKKVTVYNAEVVKNLETMILILRVVGKE